MSPLVLRSSASPVAAAAAAEALVLSFVGPVHDVAMRDKGPRGDFAFEVWFQLREAIALLHRRRSLRMTFDERAAFVMALSHVHRFIHGPGDGSMHAGNVLLVCECETAARVRALDEMVSHALVQGAAPWLM